MQTFKQNGIPKIIFGHMAAPSLLFLTDYNIFRKKDSGFRPPRDRKKKWKSIFKGSF